MNNYATNDATKQPLTFDNESNSDSSVFAPTAPAVTASAASAAVIYPDDHFLSSGIKLDTEMFSKGNINKMADKYTIGTTPAPYVRIWDIWDIWGIMI